ncbi:uncharacterized protein BDV14DRAFT_166799 [Aspergillus stella-maris]|uniref:uncharacterized protein n=1 Tax=Aspergillus stella-maris TaxID=1810926 RepID=UPI003CCD23A3
MDASSPLDLSKVTMVFYYVTMVSMALKDLLAFRCSQSGLFMEPTMFIKSIHYRRSSW